MNLATGKVLAALFLPKRGRNLAYFRSTVSSFQDTDRFQKLSYLAWNLAIGQSSTYILFLSQGSKLRLFSLYGQRFQNCIFGHETWPQVRVAHILSCCPKGLKLSLFSLYGQRFLKYRPIFKIAIFGHETWSPTKDTLFLSHLVEIKLNLCSMGSSQTIGKVPHTLFFFARQLKLILFSLYRLCFFRDMGRFWKLPYLGMELGHRKKFKKLHIQSLSTPRGWNWDYFALQAAVSEIRADFPNCHIWAWNFATGKSSKYWGVQSLSTPRGWNWTYFALRAAVSEVRANFPNCHIWAWNLVPDKRFRSCTYTLFLPQGLKLSLFSLYGQQFPRYRPIFKIVIFGHETCQVAEVLEVTYN